MPENSSTTTTPAETLQRSAGRLRDAEQLVAVTEGRELDFETADCLASLLSLVRRDLDLLAAGLAPAATEPPTLTLILAPQEGAASHV